MTSWRPSSPVKKNPDGTLPFVPKKVSLRDRVRQLTWAFSTTLKQHAAEIVELETVYKELKFDHELLKELSRKENLTDEEFETFQGLIKEEEPKCDESSATTPVVGAGEVHSEESSPPEPVIPSEK